MSFNDAAVATMDPRISWNMSISCGLVISPIPELAAELRTGWRSITSRSSRQRLTRRHNSGGLTGIRR
jgi:hypothetical protein